MTVIDNWFLESTLGSMIGCPRRSLQGSEELTTRVAEALRLIQYGAVMRLTNAAFGIGIRREVVFVRHQPVHGSQPAENVRPMENTYWTDGHWTIEHLQTNTGETILGPLLKDRTPRRFQYVSDRFSIPSA